MQIIGGKYPPSDPDTGDTLTVSAVSSPTAHGATVTRDGTAVTYTALSTFTGADSFTYTVSDGNGGTAVGTVSVTVTSDSGRSPNVVSSDILPNGHFHVVFAGIPGYNYTIQYSPGLDGPWTTITSLTAGTNGLFEFEDPTEPAPPSRYYRTTYP